MLSAVGREELEHGPAAPLEGGKLAILITLSCDLALPLLSRGAEVTRIVTFDHKILC